MKNVTQTTTNKQQEFELLVDDAYWRLRAIADLINNINLKEQNFLEYTGHGISLIIEQSAEEMNAAFYKSHGYEMP